MTTTDPLRAPHRRAGLEVDHRGGTAVLIDEAGVEVGALDVTAAALWELCDGVTTVDEIITAVCRVWAVEPAVAKRDVERTLQLLASAGFVIWEPAG